MVLAGRRNFSVVLPVFSCAWTIEGMLMRSRVENVESGVFVLVRKFGLAFVAVAATVVVGLWASPAVAAPARPTISITTPANGATYAQGQVVVSSFTCRSADPPPGVVSCFDQNRNVSGAPIDTSTTGQHTFTVYAVGTNGLSSTASVTYTVSPSGCQDPAGAFNQGFNADFNPGFDAGFNSGFNTGFRAGFQSGFTDGFGSTAKHASLRSSSLARGQAIAAQATEPACDQPFNQGFNTGFNPGFNSGFQKGFSPGFTSGFTPGFNAGHKARHHR